MGYFTWKFYPTLSSYIFWQMIKYFSILYLHNISMIIKNPTELIQKILTKNPTSFKKSCFMCFSSEVNLGILVSIIFPNNYLPAKPSKVILSPGTAPGGGARISTFSGELAHITIAWDTTPLIFAGFKLQSSIAIRFCILEEENRRIWVLKMPCGFGDSHYFITMKEL